jgi:hypothetical protein
MFTFITRLFAPTTCARTPSKPTPRARLGVEALEGRSVPALLAPVTSPAPAGVVALAIGDFNHDGRDDVASINGTFDSSSTFGVVAGNRITVSLSNGDGTFKSAGSLNLGKGGYYLGGFGAGDVNGDGHVDLGVETIDKRYKFVSIGPDEGYYVYTVYYTTWLGNGDGTFGKASTQTVKTSFPSAIGNADETFADLNRDGLLDDVRVGSSPPGAAVWLKRPDSPYYHDPLLYPAGPHPDLVGAGDFNGDGWIDIIVINSQTSASPRYSVLFNDGAWPVVA